MTQIQLTVFDIDDTLTYGAWKIEVSTTHDDASGAPWQECDGHGPVSEWTSRAKRPGERVLCSDRGSYRYYDMQEAVRMARRDGWGSLHPYTLRTYRTSCGAWIARASRPRLGAEYDIVRIDGDINKAIRAVYQARRDMFPTARAYHANAVESDFEYLRGWCNNEWYYCTIGVTITHTLTGEQLGSAYLGGIESHATDHLVYCANELLREALYEARDTVRTTYDSKRKRLERAAPAMLAALQRLVAANYGQPRAVHVPALDEARAAIATAIGSK